MFARNILEKDKKFSKTFLEFLNSDNQNIKYFSN